jgi:hypothetical protein
MDTGKIEIYARDIECFETMPGKDLHPKHMFIS